MQTNAIQKGLRRAVIIVIWLCLWQFLDNKVNLNILVAGPLDTVQALFGLVGQAEFWNTIAGSMERIAAGFSLAFFGGLFFGICSFRLLIVREFLAPVVSLARSVPVASFIVLALLWIGSEHLSVLISFLIVFPLIYEGVLSGLGQADTALLEMCHVFSVGRLCRACTVYWYSLYPCLRTACRNAIGMAWKAGVAAEVIGVPAHSLGEKLYYAKLYLDTGELFAWTLVIMGVSALTEMALEGCLWAVNQMMRCFPGSEKSRIPSGKTDLMLSGVSKKYGDRWILRQFSAVIPYGTVAVIMGESGVGKTTLLRLIAGLEQPEEGSIQNGKNDVSMAFQEDRLLEPLTAWQNCRVSAAFGEKGRKPLQIQSILKEILPEQCQRQPVSQFSGGMRRRVAIARAMLASSDVVLLDEPFSGLDEENRRKTMDFIRKYRMGRTVLFTTHRMEDFREMKAEQILKL